MVTNYDDLIHRIVQWSKSQGIVQAVIMIGSRAREADDVDDFSDLDLIVFSNSPSDLVRSDTWISTIACPWILDFTQTFAGDAEWQVIYEGGLKVDFVITYSGRSGDIAQILEGSPYQEVFDRSWKLLHFDPNQTIAISPLAGTMTMSLHRPASVSTKLSHGLFQAYGLAKSIVRNDLWGAHSYLCRLRSQIMWLIEIQARFNLSGEISTWEDSRHFNQWANQELINRIQILFPGYSQESLTRSFHFALELLDELAADVSIKTGENYPTPGQQSTINWFNELVIL